MEQDDKALLRQYAEDHSESAFSGLVARYTNLVYAAALRSVNNAHHAEEISQAVFIILAQKAHRLSPNTILSGWLYQTTRLTAANFRRNEARRIRRDHEAYMRTIPTETEPDTWQSIAPLLEPAMGILKEKERDAVVLRFFEGRSLREVGAAFGASENAAKKRVGRALEKLRGFFIKRGVAVSAIALGAAISENSIQAAPAGLAVAISATSVKGTTVGASASILAHGTLKMMTWMKLKLAAEIGAAALLIGGTSFVALSTNRDAAGSSAADAGSWLGFSGQRRFLPIDFSEKLNAKLTESVLAAGGNDGENNLAGFPQGLQHFGGTLFDVEGIVQLGSRHLRIEHKEYPERVSGLKVHERCRRLHLLHGTGWAAGDGRTIAKLVLHYADGSERELKIRYGEHVLDWHQAHPQRPTDRHATLAWTGSNPVASSRGFRLCIYKTTFENPQPDLPVETIDYVSTMVNAAPFMLGLTLE